MSGVLYHLPSEIITQLLVDLGVADDAETANPLTSWTVFAAHLPENPEQAIQVKDTTGRQHRRVHVTGVIGEHYGIQFLARSSEDPATPYRKMKHLLEFMDTQVNRELITLDDEEGVTRVYRVNAVTRTSTATPAGNDGRRFYYSGNALASIELVEDSETGTGT